MVEDKKTDNASMKEISDLRDLIRELELHRDAMHKGLVPGDQVIGVKNGQGYFLKKSHAILVTAAAIVSLVIGIVSIVGIFLQPVLWKADMENQQASQNKQIEQFIENTKEIAKAVGQVKGIQTDVVTNLQNTMGIVNILINSKHVPQLVWQIGPKYDYDQLAPGRGSEKKSLKDDKKNSEAW